MAILRYQAEELIKLRDSPLVRKPDGLPDIQQWMDVPAESSTTQRRKTQNGRPDEQAGTQDTPTQRPLLSTRHSTRSALGDDIILGPPKTSFSSTSRNQRAPDYGDKDRSLCATIDTALTDKSNFRERSLRDRDLDSRLQDKNNVLGTTRRKREDDGWTNVRGRRSSTQEDGGDRWPRVERDRERANRDGDPIDAPLRRNGVGRGRFEQSWRDETPESESARPTGRVGGWRERDRDRDRDRDSEWRGRRHESHIDEDPEWLNEDTKEEQPKKSQARTQEDFQRWKEEMKKGGKVTSGQTPAEEKTDAPLASPPLPKESQAGSKAITPLDVESGFGKLFWENNKPEVSNAEASKPAPSKPKASRFVNLFTKEEPPLPEPEPVVAPPANGTTAEDKQGFDRILQMLGAAKTQKLVETPSQPPEIRPVSEHDRKQIQTPTGEEGINFITDILARQGISREVRSVPPSRGGPALTKDQPPVSRFFPAMGTENNPTSPDVATSRGGPFVPPGVSAPIQPQQQARDADNRMFLLDLMRQAGQHGPERQHELEMMMERERLQQTLAAQAAAKDEQRRGPPPGFFDISQQQRREFDQGFKPSQGPPPTSRLPIPPGFGVEDHTVVGLQRRNTTDNPPRAQMSNLGIPSQQGLTPEYLREPGLPQNMNTQTRPNIPPPPGLNAASMRPPPGFPGHPQMPISIGNNSHGHLAMQPPLNLGRGAPNQLFGSGAPVQMAGAHGMPPPGYFGAPPGPPPVVPNGPPGFGSRDPHNLRDWLMMQAQAGPGANGGPNGPPGHGPFNGFMPGPGDIGRGRGMPPPGFGGM